MGATDNNESNRTLIQKADLEIANIVAVNGDLKEKHVSEFFKLALKPTVLLKEITAKAMTAPTENLPKAGFTTGVLRPGAEATPLTEADRVKPTLANAQLVAKEFKCEARLTYQDVEDNLMQESFTDFIIQNLGEAIGSDMERVACNGDTTSSDPVLKQINGLRKRATSVTVNHSAAAFTTTLAKLMLQAFPQEYMPASKKELRFYTSTNLEFKIRDSYASRQTTGGDAWLTSDSPVMYGGVPFIGVPHFPGNLGGGTNETEILLFQPKNAVLGFWKKVMLKTAEDIHAGIYSVVGRVRFDVNYRHEPAVVRGYGVFDA